MIDSGLNIKCVRNYVLGSGSCILASIYIMFSFMSKNRYIDIRSGEEIDVRDVENIRRCRRTDMTLLTNISVD